MTISISWPSLIAKWSEKIFKYIQMIFKRYIQTDTISSVLMFIMTSKHSELVDGLAYNIKNLTSQKRNMTFVMISFKKNLTLFHTDYIFRRYHFLAEVTFKYISQINQKSKYKNIKYIFKLVCLIAINMEQINTRKRNTINIVQCWKC